MAFSKLSAIVVLLLSASSRVLASPVEVEHLNTTEEYTYGPDTGPLPKIYAHACVWRKNLVGHPFYLTFKPEARSCMVQSGKEAKVYVRYLNKNCVFLGEMQGNSGSKGRCDHGILRLWWDSSQISDFMNIRFWKNKHSEWGGVTLEDDWNPANAYILSSNDQFRNHRSYTWSPEGDTRDVWFTVYDQRGMYDKTIDSDSFKFEVSDTEPEFVVQSLDL